MHTVKSSENMDNGNGFLKQGNGNGVNGKKHHRHSHESCSSNDSRSASPTYSQFGETYTYEFIEDIANHLLEKTTYRPTIGIICGSGLGGLANSLENSDIFPYEDIPNFPVSTVPGHAGCMVFGSLNGIQVMAMQGRFHYYEGYPLAKCSMPVRVMKLCGIKTLICTNAAGGLNETYNVGDIMIVRDHINVMGFAGNSPLLGPNDPRFGPRFPPMNKAYDPEIIKAAKEIAKEMGIENQVHEGVYTCLGGPNYETVAELRMWKILGIDAVGMSTVHEVITAKHCDLKVFTFSLITNKCTTSYECKDEANHTEVMEVGTKRSQVLKDFVSKLVAFIDNQA